MSEPLGVDTAELRALAGQFDDLADQLRTAISPLDPGPGHQPTSAAVTAVATSADHVTKIAGSRLSKYGDNLTRAAAAYDATDAVAAHDVDATMRQGR